MAMFLSRLKQILNLGTKSITANGTYSASGDGYDGYSQVSVNMPSVTPSNSTPAALTSGNAVTPNANGYAIESYRSVAPDNSAPPVVSSGDIVKITDRGGLVVVSQPAIYSITPSDSSPVSLSAYTNYQPTTKGYAIKSNPTNITPSKTPQSILADKVYKMSGAGSIVSSIGEAWPDDDDPQYLNYENTYWIRGLSGYLYARKQNPIPDVTSPDVNWHNAIGAGNTVTISVTKKPRLIFIWSSNSASGTAVGIGEAGLYDVERGVYYRQGYYSSGYSNSTTGGSLQSVSSSSVVINNPGTTTRRYQVSIYY